MKPRIISTVAAAAAVVLLVSGLFAGAATAGESETDPMLGAPAVGDCYDLTYKQASEESTREATVDCSRKHTLLVGAVGQVPESFDWEDSADNYKYSHKICDPFWKKYYDLTEPRSYLTLLRGNWFTPTEAQRDNGARWISCEIGLDTDGKLLPLPAGGPATMTRKPVDSIARCADARYRVTPCSKAHAWRATYAFGVKAKGSDKAVGAKLEKAAKRTCSRHASSATWLRSIRYIGNSRYAIACFSKTKR
jgi:hypothetical protein